MSMRSPTTRPVVVAGSDDATVRVWDLEARALLYQPLEAHQGKVNAVAVGNFHGRPVAVSGGNDLTVRVWDLLTGRPRVGRLWGMAARSWRWPSARWAGGRSRCRAATTTRCGSGIWTPGSVTSRLPATTATS